MDNTMKIGIVVLAVIALIYMVSNYSKKREGFVDLDQDEGFTDGGDELAEENEGPMRQIY